MQQHIQFGTKTIHYSLKYSQRKSLRIIVHPDATIDVVAPFETDAELIKKKVKTKAPWILKQLFLFNSFLPNTPERSFVSGETHLYLGRQYKLKIVEDLQETIKIYRGQLWIYSRDTKRENLKNRLEIWYRQKAEFIFSEILENVLPKFHKFKIETPSITLRVMSKRWGSCTSSGKLILNPELVKASKGCIEYVIIHELCHLVEHNHTKAFYELLGNIMPDWKKWKDRLEYTLA